MNTSLVEAVAVAEERRPVAIRWVALAGVADILFAVLSIWELRDGRVAAAGALGALLVLLLVFLVAGVVWLRWFVAVYAVVQLAGRARFGTAYAVVGWLVPILSIVAPVQLVTDVWRAPSAFGEEYDRPLPRPVALRRWITLWIATGVLSLVGQALDDVVPVAGGVAGALALVGWIVMAWYAIATVRLLTERVALLPDLVPPPRLAAGVSAVDEMA